MNARAHGALGNGSPGLLWSAKVLGEGQRERARHLRGVHPMAPPDEHVHRIAAKNLSE